MERIYSTKKKLINALTASSVLLSTASCMTPNQDNYSLPPLPTSPVDQCFLHTVAEGESLKSLADEYLGDSSRYREIFDSNRDRMTSPLVTTIGQELTICGADSRVARANPYSGSETVPVIATPETTRPNLTLPEFNITDELNESLDTMSRQVNDFLKRGNELAERILKVSSVEPITPISVIPTEVLSPDLEERLVAATVKVYNIIPPSNLSPLPIKGQCSGVIIAPGLVTSDTHCYLYVTDDEGDRWSLVAPDGTRMAETVVVVGDDVYGVGQTTSVEAFDIGLLRMENFPSTLPVLPIADSKSLKRGDTVFFANYQDDSPDIVRIRGVFVGEELDNMIIAVGADIDPNFTRDVHHGGSGGGVVNREGLVGVVESLVEKREEQYGKFLALAGRYMVNPNDFSQFVFATKASVVRQLIDIANRNSSPVR